MNAIEIIAGQMWIERMGWVLLHSFWQGAIVAALLAVALAALRRRSAQARYLASCAALAALLLLPLVTWIVLRPHELPAPQSSSDRASTEHAQPVRASTTPIKPVKSTSVVAAKSAPATTEWRVNKQLLRPILPWMVAAWFAGVILCSIRLLGGLAYARRLRTGAQLAVPEPWPSLLASLAERMKIRRAVGLFQTALINSPVVVGWIKPAILIPTSIVTGFTPAQIESILCHELAHIRRHDYLINLIQNVAEALLFYHPAAWWISGRIRLEREHCCDDAAVQIGGDRLAYAQALLRLEEVRWPEGRLVVAARGGSLIGRLRRIAGTDRQGANPSAQWMAGGIIMLSSMLILSCVAYGSRTHADSPIAAPATTKAGIKPLPQWTVHNSEGRYYSLLAVGRPSEYPNQWWDPEGRSITLPPNWNWNQFIPVNAGKSLVGICQSNFQTVLDQYNLEGENPESYWLNGFAINAPDSVTVGFGKGPWREEGNLRAGETIEIEGTPYKLARVRDLGHKKKNKKGMILFEIEHPVQKDVEVSVVVVEKNNNRTEVPPKPLVNPPADGIAAKLQDMPPVDINDIDHFILRSRPRQFHKFAAVAEKPSEPAPIEKETVFTSRDASERAKWSAQTSGGETFELVAIGRYFNSTDSWKSDGWWKPDGTPLKGPITSILGVNEVTNGPKVPEGTENYQFVMVRRSVPPDGTVQYYWKSPPTAWFSLTGWDVPPDDQARIGGAVHVSFMGYRKGEIPAAQTLTGEIVSGPWITGATFKPGSEGGISQVITTPEGIAAMFSSPIEADGKTIFPIAHTWKTRESQDLKNQELKTGEEKAFGPLRIQLIRTEVADPKNPADDEAELKISLPESVANLTLRKLDTRFIDNHEITLNDVEPPADGRPGSVTIDIKSSVSDLEPFTRIVAQLKDGSIVPATEASSTGVLQTISATYEFNHARNEIESVQFQTCSESDKIVFSNISLKPGNKTNATVRIEKRRSRDDSRIR